MAPACRMEHPRTPAAIPIQPVPKDCDVLYLAGRTVIAREWHDGQLDLCRLCPACPFRGTGANLCQVAVPGDVPAASAALFHLGGYVEIVRGGGPLAEDHASRG